MESRRSYIYTSKTNKEGSTNILEVVNLYPVFENFERVYIVG